MTSDGAATSDVARFLTDLRTLRAEAGAPSYTALARGSGLPRSTLHDALTGTRLPSREVTLGLVRACGGDPDAWRQRWTDVRSGLDTAVAAPAPAPRPRWRPRRLRLVLVAAALVVPAALLSGWSLLHDDCTGTRVYRVDSPGAVLDADGHPIGRVTAGDTVRVRSLVHDHFPHRYFGTVDASGTSGYLDEAKLTFVRTSC